MPTPFRSLLIMTLLVVLLPPALQLTPTAAALQGPAPDVPPALLIPGGRSLSTRVELTADPTVLRHRLTQVQLPLLEAAGGPTTGRRISLNLFDDVNLIGVLDLASSTGPGHAAWTGRIETDPYSSITLALEGTALAGNIRVGEASYQIRLLENGSHVVIQVDPRAFPDEAPPRLAPAEQSRAPQPGAVRPFLDNGSLIDMLVVYTADARTGAGGTAGMNSLIALMITETNTSYANSGVTPRMRLAGSAEVTYTESADLGVDLDALTEPADGKLDNVHTLRNQFAADLVSLIVENSGQTGCGIGWLMGTASASFENLGFNVTRRSCATGNYSFGHEGGHNMGATHDRGVVSNPSATAFNFGFVTPSKAWRTIMAYGTTCSNCPRLLYWSNPNVTYQGSPMGIAQGQANAADNRSVLNNNALIVSNFRASSVGGTPTPTSTLVPGAPTATRTPVPPTRTSTAVPTPPPVTSCAGLDQGPTSTAAQTSSAPARTRVAPGAGSLTAPGLGGIRSEAGKQRNLITRPRSGAPANASVAPRALPGGTTILCETWESTPNANWVTFDNDFPAANGDRCWGLNTFHKRNGSRSIWPAAGCANGLDPAGFYYPTNVNSWLVYGPFSLADATAAQVQFSLWYRTELNFDYIYWTASVDGENFYGEGVSGSSTPNPAPTSTGWQDVVFNFADVPELGSVLGQPQVWIAFIARSDGSEPEDLDGPFLDEVVIQKVVGTGGLPAIAGRDFSLRSGSVVMNWTGGTSTTGILPVRWGSTSGTSFLFQGAGFLPGTATTFTDNATLTDEAYCYLIVALGGNPASTNNFQGLSDFMCIYSAAATGNPAQNLTIRLSQSPTASLSWNAPASAAFTGYRLTAHRFDGQPDQVVNLPATATSHPYPTGGVSTCFKLETLNGAAVTGLAKQLCGVPGIAFLPSGGPAAGISLEDAFGRLAAALRQNPIAAPGR